ncbi:LysR substrate-binding domain-containing protein [Billgrantia aerodenitrificans]|uniref:LysR family transcriptional regulator n=1 Tax=Billgrantia aerodenitrificans TaxID=2733483 RepID=A0ABS9ARF2_9GAMM|nr:LysR substrate-binding domain-containing protein [Halomonas aerodenitrificans]MCE8024364.1 LysR family transcriptional regulator [Halomonas aerodenitrificans]
MSLPVTFRQIQVFAAVARNGTVITAAQQLHLSQSATSQALSDLERQLGVALFERLGRRLCLNDIGRHLLPQAERLLDGMEVFVRSAQEPEGRLSGTLNVSASATIGTYLLPALAGRFSERHPGADLRLNLRNTGEVVMDLLRLNADLGLIEGQCHEPRLASEAWCQDRMVIICSPQHPLARAGRLERHDLSDVSWIMREKGSGTREVFEIALGADVDRLAIRMELGQHEAIKQAVRAGLGLGCLSWLSVVGEIERGELIALSSDLCLTRRFSLVWHPERYRSPLWQAFKVFLVEQSDRYPNG